MVLAAAGSLRSVAAACADLSGHTFASANDRDGFLAFAANGQVVWYPEPGVLLPGLWRCEGDLARLRLVDAPPELAEDAITVDGGRLAWNDSVFVLADDPAASVVASIDDQHDPALDRCENLAGSIYEIRSLEGLPGNVDPSAPRRPYLQLFEGRRGRWVPARGETQAISWICDDRGLQVAYSGKPVLFERAPGGFTFGRAPVRRFRPRGEAAKPVALDCAGLRGRAFEIGEREPARSDPFVSADPKPRPPSLVFATDAQRVEWIDVEETLRSLDYTCDTSGVVVKIGGSPSRMAFDGLGLRWLAQPVRPVVSP